MHLRVKKEPINLFYVTLSIVVDWLLTAFLIGAFTKLNLL